MPRGDTAGAVIILQDVRVSAGDRDLVTDATVRVEPGTIVGLVGANGCGKSTLLRCISGQRQIDQGNLLVAPNIPVIWSPERG